MSGANGSNGSANGHANGQLTLVPPGGEGAPAAQASFAGPLGPVRRVRGNVKGAEIDLTLSPLTAIVGDNRRGKTRIPDTIQIAVLGKHSQVGGAPGVLGTLAPAGAKQLVAEAYFDNAVARLTVDETHTKRPSNLQHSFSTANGVEVPQEYRERVMPALSLAEMLETVEKGRNVAREEVFKRFGSVRTVPKPGGMLADQESMWREALLASCEIEVPEELTKLVSEVSKLGEQAPADLRSRALEGLGQVERRLSEALEAADPAVVLSDVAAWFRSQVKRQGDQARAFEKAAADATVNDSSGAELVPVLEKKIKAARAWEAGQAARDGLAAARANLLEAEAQLAQLTQQGAQFEQAVAAARQNAAEGEQYALAREAEARQAAQAIAADKRRAERAEVVAEIYGVYEQNKHAGHPVQCFCETPEAPRFPELDPGATKDRLLGRAGERRQAISGTEQQHAELLRLAREARASTVGAIRQAEGAYQQFMVAKRGPEQRASNARAQIASLEKVLGAVEHDGTPSATIEAQLAVVKSAASKKETREDLIEKQHVAERRVEIAQFLAKQAQSLLTEMLQKVKKPAEATMNAYMADGFRAELELTEKVCRWTSVGADGRGHARGAASGAEYGALILALPQAWTHDSPDRIVFLDDAVLAPFSPQNVWRLLDRFAQLVLEGKLTQVIVCWSRRNEIPPAYTVIDLDAPAEAAQIGAPA